MKQNQKNPQWVHLQYFHLTVYLSTIWLTDWGGVREGGRGAGHSQKSLLDEQTPQTSQGRPRRWVGGARRGNEWPKAGTVLYTSKAYISSEQNDSFYFMQKIEVECTLQKPSLAPRRRMQTRKLRKLGARWMLSTGWGRGSGCHLASLPQKCTVSVLFVNTSGLNIGIVFPWINLENVKFAKFYPCSFKKVSFKFFCRNLNRILWYSNAISALAECTEGPPPQRSLQLWVQALLSTAHLECNFTRWMAGSQSLSFVCFPLRDSN